MVSAGHRGPDVYVWARHSRSLHGVVAAVCNHPLRLDLYLLVVEAEAVSRLKVGVQASSFPAKRSCGQQNHLRRLHRSRLVALRVWNLNPEDCRVYSDDVSVVGSHDHRRSCGRGLSVF